MALDDVCILVTETMTQNQYGVYSPTQTRNTVFCRAMDITRNEFFQAGRSGLTPQLMLVMFSGNYSGEEVCIYNGTPYHIYRTYHVPGTDDLELYLELKGGTNGKASN